MRKGWLQSSLACVLLSCVFSAALAAAPAIPLYHATYSMGSVLTADFSLTQNKDGTYTYRSVTQTSGLVALFRRITFTETSHFAVAHGNLQPLLYSYIRSDNGNDQSETIQFDWNKGVAYSTNGGKPRMLPLKAGTYDRLLAQLAISMNLEAGKTVEDYPVLDHNKINIYHMQQQGSTTLKTPAGEYEVIEIARKALKKDRVTTFWLAPKLDYLPVQMQQTETGKATISLVLTKIKLDTK
ncbi:MAG: DUF3108 domain-containing protein [Gammaproteobacteria bacterium]